MYQNKIFSFLLLALIMSVFSCCVKANNDIRSVNSINIDSVKIWSHPNNRFQINNSKKMLSIYFDKNESKNQVDIEWFLTPDKSGEVIKSRTIVNLEQNKDTQVEITTSKGVSAFFIRPLTISNDPFKQDQFVISTFSVVPYTINEHYTNILTNTKRANLSHVETAFVSPEGSIEVLRQAEDLGLKVIVQDFTRFGGFQNSPEHISNSNEKTILDAIQRYSKYNSFYGYYLWDEPFFEQFPQARKDLDFLKANDPNKLYLIATLQSYSPDYTWENNVYPQYIEELLNRVRPNLLCTNYYYFANDYIRGIKLTDSYIWKDWGYIRKKAIEHGLPFWYYIQLMGDILNNQVGDITIPQIAAQNYMALAFGAKGISYYNTIQGIIDDTGEPTHLFEDVSQLNKEIMFVGNQLLGFTTDKIYYTGKLRHGNFLNKLSESKLVKSTTSDVLIGEFIEDSSNKKMLLIVNVDFLKTTTGELNFFKQQRIKQFNNLDDTFLTLGESQSFSYSLEPGQGVLITID